MDDSRIRAFVAQDYRAVVAAVAVSCGDRHRAEESVQEALARALPRLHRIVHLRSWVVRVAMNDAHSAFRRRAAERRAYERLCARSAEEHAVFAADPAELLADARLAAALAGLPTRQRQVVALHYLLDLDIGSIATTLGIHEGTVKTLLFRARASLRGALATTNPEAEEAAR